LKLDPSLEDARRGRGRVQVLLAKRSNPGAQANASAGTAAVSLAMAPPGRRVALVIGMSAYVNVAPLRNPTNDARAVADAFRRLGFAEVIEREDLTRVRLEEVLKDFGDKAAEADWAVIYYAGHGIQINGANYVVPVDAKLDRADHIEDETVTLRRVLSKAQEARKLRMVIVDACRSNPFRMASADGGSRAIGRGLSPIEPAGGVLVAFAARGGTIADDGGGEHSPFTQALLANIETPDLDIRIMFSKVRDQVLARTNNAQEPFTYGSLPGEELYFKQSAKSYMSSTPPLPTGQTNVAMVPVRPVEKPPSPGDGTVPTRQKVVLYEENPTDPAGTRFGGNVTWRTERIARPSGQKPEVVIRGDIEIPERKISVRLSLQRNEDKKVPASHEVDVQFKLPPAFSNGGVANIPGIMVKDGENHRGTALTAAVVKVTDSFFLVGLAEGEMQRNVQLLKDRSWLDIPIVYADGKRALMAIEKGPSGERAFADAFAAWAQVDNAGRPIAQTLKGDDKAGQPRPDAAPTSVHTVRIPPDAGMAPAGATGQHDGTR
ncbi:MAG: caspase family protein, partial [Bradyrhizobiaceae bacterium]|nr:caspase family protein [Bradyrhizobiaceae bacterium]